MCNHVPFEESFCRKVELALRREYPDRKIEVQNAGMDWHTTQHSLMKYLFILQDFDPDLIVIYHAINDLCRSLSPPLLARGEYRTDYSHYYGPVARMVDDYFDVSPQPTLLVYGKISEMIHRYWFSDFRMPDMLRQPREIEITEWKSLPAFTRNLRDLADILRQKNVHLIMASQPYLYKTNMTPQEQSVISFADKLCRNVETKPNLASMISGMNQFNDAARHVATENDIPFVELEHQMPKTLDYFYDDVHYTPLGNTWIADQITAQIISSGFLTVENK